MTFTARTDLFSSSVESVSIELHLKGAKSVLFSCVYNPPDRGADVFQGLEKMLESFPNDLEYVVLGDFNIDLLPIEDCRLMNIMKDN